MSNSINITNNLTSTSIPELYIRYFNPKININTDIIIPYYVSDSTQEEFLRNTNTKSFTTIVKIGNNTFSQTTNAGEYSINIGSISTTGETYFSIYTIDENGVASVEQFFDILIIDSSYTITSSQTYTMVDSDLTKYNITVGESVSNTIAQSNNTGLNNLFNDVKNNGYRKIIMLNRIYMLDYHGDKIMPPSEFTVDMNNATFKATQCTDINVANLVDLRDCFDTHVINGNLVGNYDGFDFATTQSTTGYYIPGEGLAVAEMNGAKYSSFENMDMSYSVGYNLGVFGGKNAGYIGTAGSLKFSNAYYINGENTVSSNVLSTTDLIDITGILDRGELQCSVYLNYGGLKLNKAELFIHFYNSSSNYMTTVKTRQYQMVKIPNGATKVRITGFTTPSTDNSGLSICHTGYSKNCELINIKSHNTRTCAMHPGIYNHLLIKDCTFNRVADENEYKVTKLALDFEDGYENGRNLFFINNEVYEGTSALTIQRCFNANIIGCRNFGLDTRGHIKGAYIKNNFFNNGDIYTTNFDSQSHLKLINNTFFKTLNFLKWDDTGNYDSIGLTELDCKNGYTNNKNCTLFIRNESSGGSEGGGGGTNTPTSYTITNNLTNCTTNNSDTSVSNGSNYSATLSPNSGYVMSSIVVTMGGNDISSTVVSGNNISISNIMGNIVITAVASEQAEVLPEITLFDNGLTENYTISNGSNYTVNNLITLSHSSNTYFGFDQSVIFNAGDSINFIIDSCSHDASAYVTRVCYLDDSNTLQGYETAVTDDIISAGLPYTLTHTFKSKTTIRPALMKYFGNITISKVYVSRAGSSNETKHYLVTNNLANCTNSNKSTTIQNNSSYSATISPNEGYSITSITVTMGGTDITSSAVNGNNINISNVTGNIVITVNTSVSESGRELTTTILNMQYASAHEVLPNAPIDDVWKDKPREGKGSTIPTQNCTECASGTHTASESYSAGSLWSTFGQWATIYKIKGTNLVENVGVEITDFKMWRYNENTNSWVLVNDTFDYGAFYYETFWDDGSAPLNDHKILSGDKKTYKCLMDSQTSGRCFHPFSTQKKWSDYGFTTNPSYIVVQMKARLIVWDENGADNRASANLCMNVGGDYWIRQGASFDDQWRHNGDMMVGYYKKITNDWRYVYMTTCPQTWNKGFPCDSATDSGSGGTTSNPIELTLPSSMTCTKGEVFNITYNTNIEAVKHEMSWDGGTTYIDITSDIIADGTNYIYTHEAINDTTWNPVTRYIRVTNADGNTSTGSISITINEEPSSGGTTDKIQLNLASTMNCTKGEAFNITYSTNVEAIKHEMSWDGGNTYNEVTTMVTVLDNNNYTYTHEAISDTTWNPVTRWIRVTDANGNTATGSISITISSGINTYNITNNLENCSNNNTNTSIEENESYSATISPNEGYSITSITVTMGGNDITNTVVDGKTITIKNVTGDIIITAKTSLLSTDGHTVTYNLTNCTSLNDQVDVTSGESYYTTITANDGYVLTGIIVTMNGIDITTDVVDENNNIHITKVTGDVVITATVREEGVTTNTYRVTYNLNNCTSSNTNSTVEENASYSTTVTANNNYTLGNIIVTMDGVDITSTAVSNNNINISSVTGNIVITATATATSSGGSGSGGTNYTITYNLTHCTTDSTQTSVSSGDYYHTNVIADTGYTISNITVTMGGIDISNSCILNSAVDISNITGNIVITATAIANSSTGDSSSGSGGSSGGTPTYTVTYNLSNCYTDSTQKTVNQGDYYYTNVMANSGYTLSSVTVAMGGVDVTSLYVDSNNVVNITNVTGDIIITATATVSSSSGGSGGTSTYYNVTYNLTYCSSSSSVSSVASGSSYYTYINPNTNYTLDNISVTMGGVNITSSAVSGNDINISNVTGNIVITATASYTQNVTYYSVTYNLTYCSSSSSVSSVASGNSYYTNITANTNCTMSNISVTMDGTNITSSAVSDNNINISSVTGNIVITATATANVSQTYTSPTVSFDYGKAVVTQNGYTETFDLAYAQNTGYSGYNSSKTVTDSGGYTYYLTLSDSGTSNFRIDSKYPTSGGWMSTTNSNGEEYTFGRYPLCYYNNGWTYSMTNVNNSVPSALLTESLKYFNASFPALNLSANGGTTSTIEMADYNETWLGLTVRYSEHFEIKVNKKTLTSNYGSYESSTTATRKWISTIVHEMGHILGFVDNASHTPSLYDYRRDREKCLFLQPNDLYALKFFLKNNFGVDITTYGEPEEVKDVATISSYSLINDVEETDVEFNFDYLYYQDDELEEISDVIVKCKLKYKSTDTLDVHNDEDSNLYFDYNIYEMEMEESIKGELTNNLLKIHISENLEIDENKTYKLYLRQFDNTPCSLVNIKQGVVEL